MRKNMIFGMIGFVLAVVTCGQALAALGPGEISMGVFSIPKPVDGKDGCTPVITVTSKDSNGCYTTKIQKKLLQSGSCVNDGDEIVRETCDGENGAGGGEIDLNDVYVPYPASTQEYGAGPNQQGFIKKLVNNEVVAKIEDNCDKDYDATNGARMKCVAQGDATAWPVGGPYYETGDTYYFTITDPADVCASVSVSDWGDTQRVTKSQYFEHSGTQTQGVVGYLDTVNTMCDGTDQENIKQDICSPVRPTAANGGTNVTCVNRYTWQRCINQTVAASANDSQRYYHGCFLDTTGRAVVSRQTNQYQGPDLTNKIKGYTYTLVTYSNGDTDRIDEHEDECDPVVGTTSAADSTLKTGQRCKCGGMTSSAPCNVANGTYLLGVYGGAQDLLSVMQNQVQVKIKMFGTTLYYCSGSATCCDANQTPGEGDFATCWTSVNIAGLHGDNGASCLATKSGSDWYICCSPSYTGDDCNKVIDDDIIAMLNGMMCQVNYTHKYLHDDGNGGFTADTTKDGARGERVIVTNSCNNSTENLDTYYGEDGPAGDDYNPCDGLSDTEALSTVSRRTTVYVRHGSTDNSTTTTGIGYYTETNVMCDTSGNKIVKKYDKCDPVSLASGASRTVGGKTCSGNQTLLMCTPQEEPTTPYYVCSDAEVSNYPKLVYVAPTVSDGKFTARGYTKWVHKYPATGSEVVGDVNQKDLCHPVYKLSRTNSNNTVTATTSSVQKCQIQSPGTTGFTADEWYCLNTTDNVAASCNGYSDTISDSETSILKYHLPIMDGTTPTGAGYTYYEVKDGSNVTVREKREDKDKCEVKILGRNASSNSNNSAVVTQCTVIAPMGTPGLNSPYTAGAIYCLGYANGTCPGGLTDIGSAIDAAADAETDPCASVADNATLAAKTVKKTEYEYVAKGATVNNTGVGYVKKTKVMCDDTLTVPHKEEEILYDTCEAVKNDNTCLGSNYQCYNQTKIVGDTGRAYKTCNPNANVDSILVANKIDEKLNKDITFEVKQNSQDGNKDYITITGTNMTDKPVVALESLQGQSVFDIWKEEQTENTKCQALFDKNCSELTTSDMLLDLSAQGNWARSEYGKNPSLTHAYLGGDDFQESLKPCKTFDISEDSSYSGNDGKRYTMTCVQ